MILRKYFLYFILTVLFLLFTYLGGAVTYYIDPYGSDSNDGSAGSPWASLSHACSQVTTPGDVIHLNAGTYNVTSSVSLSNGVSIRGEGVSSVISSTVGGKNYTLMLMGKSPGTNGNQSISNVKFDGNNLTAYAAIKVYQLSNVELSYCTFIDFNYYGVRFLGENAAPPNIYETGNSFHDNIVTNCSGFFPAGEAVSGEGKGAIDMRAQDGMLIYNNELTQVSRPAGSNGYLIKGVGRYHKNLKIYNNTITKAPFDGLTWDFAIELWDVRGGCEIYNNKITAGIDIAGTSSTDEVGAGYSVWIHDNTIGPNTLSNYENATGILLEQSTNDVIIEKNFIKNVSRGIYFPLHGAGVAVNNIRINNNIFYHIGATEQSNAYRGYGIEWAQNNADQTIDNLILWNNTFVGLGSTNKSMAAIKLPVNGYAKNISIRNNIITQFYYTPILGTEQGNLKINNLSIENNIFYNNGNNNFTRYNNVTPTNNTTQNNIKQDPLFVSSTDFRLSSVSPAIDKGLDVGLKTDHADKSIIGAPDIGAFEFQLRASQGSDTQTTENSGIQEKEVIKICEGESYEGWIESGEYERTLTASSGADSIVTTMLTVHPVKYTTEDITIYEGESYEGWIEPGKYERTLVASSGCDSIVTTNLKIEQEPSPHSQIIYLGKGWNTFSTYLIPTKFDMDYLMEGLKIQNQLVEVQDEDGKTYEKDGTEWKNNIGEFRQTEGYKIKVNSSSVLNIDGHSVLLPLDIELNKGWNIVSFPYNGSVNAMEVIQPLIDAGILEKVQDEKGNSIEDWGNLIGWINGIGNFVAGEGYLIQVNKNGVLSIWDEYEKSGLTMGNELETEYFKVDFEGNGIGHMNINITGLNETNLQVGDEIAAFDGDICVGAVKLDEINLMNSVVSIRTSVADEGAKNGFIEGDSIHLRIWDTFSNKEANYLTNVVTGKLIYQKQGSVFVQLTEKKKDQINDFNAIEFDMYPNPASEKLNLKFSSMPQKETIMILSDITGKTLMRRQIHSPIENLDIQTQSSGIYFVAIISGENYSVKKLIIK